MITHFKRQLSPIVAIIARPFLSWNPSVLTTLSLVSAILFFVGLLSHMYLLAFLAMAGSLFDAVDGYVARTRKKVSPQGAFLDSVCDRVSDFFFIVAFGFGGIIPWQLMVAVLFTSEFVSYLRARSESLFPSANFSKGIMQRSERILLLFLAFLLFVLFPHVIIGTFPLAIDVFIFILIFNCFTIFQRVLNFAKISKKQ